MWWIDTKAPGRFFAMGNPGQFIYVAPDRDAVLIRPAAHTSDNMLMATCPPSAKVPFRLWEIAVHRAEPVR